MGSETGQIPQFHHFSQGGTGQPTSTSYSTPPPSATCKMFISNFDVDFIVCASCSPCLAAPHLRLKPTKVGTPNSRLSVAACPTGQAPPWLDFLLAIRSLPASKVVWPWTAKDTVHGADQLASAFAKPLLRTCQSASFSIL